MYRSRSQSLDIIDLLFQNASQVWREKIVISNRKQRKETQSVSMLAYKR